ncbi:4338_t:CDS:2 [Funneliformis mosseae]|uniref:poly(A)-specific ribonuclease n=1 Tax=Funneliformis mosseae TaxID=27381 RepID=A0A9N9C734_FUNMO|nr:4338_t:CDS:2 [Funneliformis mosseae]
MPTNNESKYIKEVWAENLEEEMAVLRDLVEQYPFLAMDTEFPGVVARPIGSFRTSSDYHYQTLRCNVDLLKIIQLGITFADENGTLPPDTCTWQFNFKFNLGGDMYAQDSIDLLTKSGIDFKKHEDYGIDVEHFGELLISSGFVLLDDVKWISYHSGYDFGYLLKVLTCSPLPAEESEFFDLLRTYFPCIYDIKFLVRSFKNLKGGLQDIADDLQVTRIGPQHQAGSDSLLTATTFFKMRQTFFNDKIDDTKYLGYLYGLGTTTNVPNVMIGTPPILNNNVSIVNVNTTTSDNGHSNNKNNSVNSNNHNSPTTNTISTNIITINPSNNSTSSNSNNTTTTNTNGTSTPINSNN